MNKRMRELQALINSKTAEAQSFMSGDNKDIEKANKILDEIDQLQKEFETEERLMKASKSGVPVEPESTGAAVEGSKKLDVSADKKSDSIKSFAAAARSGFKAMTEGTGADGGFTVPEDINTQINEFKSTKFALADYVDYESVTSNKGSRVYKTRSQQTGFTLVGEGAKIGAAASPKFTKISYEIKKYAGYLPATNELLADSDAAITGVITEWLAGDSVATANAQIVAKINAKEATSMTGLKDIKKAVNVTLSDFKDTCKIYTNDDGIDWLDTLEDKNGRPLLSPDPTQPMQMKLSVGARSIPIVQIPNSVMPTNAEDSTIPVVIGDLSEYVKMFDRQQMSIATSSEASVTGLNAFEQDMTIFRAIMRADFVVKDSAAIVRGALTVAAAASTTSATK